MAISEYAGDSGLKLYKLPFVMHEPSHDTEDKFLAEIPVLPGCRAWGDTYDEALENLQGVAAAILKSYGEWGDKLPAEVQKAIVDIDAADEVLVIA